MTFIWPAMLLSLLSIPVVLLFYLRMQAKRRKISANLAQLTPGKPGRRRDPGFRRHLPPAFFLVGLAILLFALARPQAEVTLPRIEGTVILVFDVSGSMAAEDAESTRLEAAKATAREFILNQPETIKIGVVTFSRSGFSVQKPTSDTQNLLAAVNRLKPESGTSLGQGILAALHVIAVNAGLQPSLTPTSPTASPPADGQSTERRSPEEEMLAQLPSGPYPAALIVILSDGENNQSIDPVEAAQAAYERGVRVDALGFGTTGGAVLEVDGFKIHSALNEELLREIVQAAGGTYYHPQTDENPKSIYENLRPQLAVKPDWLEITSIFAGISLVFLLVGIGFSLAWFNRML